MNQPGSLWKDLAEEPRVEPGWHTRRIFPDAISDIRAAILEPGATPALLIELASSAIPPDVDYPSSRGFVLSSEIAVPGPGGRTRLCLLLSDRVFLEVFEVLCQDVAGTIAEAFTERETVQALLSRLRIWQGFMKRYGSEGLGLEEQIGLFAELFFLTENVIGRVSPFRAVQSWKGPAGGVQDFEFPGCSIEVKSTTILPPGPIKISSLSQLDETRVKRLVLCHMTFDTGSVSGLTLPELVQRIRGKLGSEDRSAVMMFNESLLEAGYLDIHEGLYSGRRYLVRSVCFFEVTGDFPRIRASEVRTGVLSGSYGIEFSACLPFELDAERVRNTMLED